MGISWLLIILIGIFSFSIASSLQIEQQVRVTVLPGSIDVFSPVQNEIYENRMVPINLTMNTEVVRFTYIDNERKPGTLCRRCSEYGYTKLKRKPFDDGFHQMTILAEFESGTVYHYVNFTVDTTKPIIKSTEPSRGFATGLFSVEFDEENPESVFLNYRNETDMRSEEIDLSECYDYKRKTRCDVNVSLTYYDGQEIEYWFNITDIIGNFDESRARKLDVDMTAPKLLNPDSFWKRGEGRYSDYAYFDMEIDEKNFDEAVLIYDYRGRTRETRLCSRLRNGKCTYRFKLNDAYSNFKLILSDEAGNSEERAVEFEV